MNARKLSMMLNVKSLVRNVITPIIGHPIVLTKASVGSVLDSIVTDMYTYNGEKLGKTMGNITKAERKDIQPFIDAAVEKAKLENRLGITTLNSTLFSINSDEKLANKLNVSFATINRWETGKVKPIKKLYITKCQIMRKHHLERTLFRISLIPTHSNS